MLESGTRRLFTMSTEKKPRILVTDAGRGSAVTIIRSLGRAGWEVIAADSDPAAIGFSSRYACDKVVYPRPGTAPERFVEVLLENVRRLGVDLVLPVTDAVLQPLISASALFDGVCKLGIPDREAYEIVTDKSRTLQLADRLGIPRPRTCRVRTLDDLEQLGSSLEFPVVVKPECSVKLCSNGEYRSFSVSYARDMDALRETMIDLGGEVGVLLQEYTAGAGCGIEIVADRGECLCVFEHRRLAEVPVTGGASAWRESVATDPVLLSYAKKLVAELEWTGPIMVEFKVGEKISLMEINGRVWGSLPLAVAAGVDIPRIWAGIYLEASDTPPTRSEYPTGIRTYNLDLMSVWIVNVITGRCSHPYLPHPPRWEAFRGLFAMLSGSSHSDLVASDDPLPARLQRRGIPAKIFGKFWREMFPART